MLENKPFEKTDPLSDALKRMSLEAFINVALDAGGTWAVDFPGYEGLTFNVIQKGECLLSVSGGSQTIRLRTGDCFLLTGGRKFSLASNLSPKRRLQAAELFSQARDGYVTCNGGGSFLVIGTIFRFRGHLPKLLFAGLPPVICIDAGSDHAAVLRWNLDRFGAEMRGDGVGRSLVLSHLAPIMLLQILRIYLCSSPKDKNWLTALSNPKLGAVLDAIQTDYRRDWSLEELATLANMSRSGFALTFKNKVGVSPLTYLMNWRMQIACELLQAGDESISSIANAVGYSSESAFSGAFARTIKCRPGAFRRQKLSK